MQTSTLTNKLSTQDTPTTKLPTRQKYLPTIQPHPQNHKFTKTKTMSSPSKNPPTKPLIILHGGCGNITRSNLPPSLWQAHRAALLSILHSHATLLSSTDPGASALETATSAVAALENNPLFNAGRGAVFTRAGTIELEASVMVSRGKRKRGVGVMGVTRVRNPVLLAREMLVRGEEEGGGGAQGHCQIDGRECERLAGRWGLELVGGRYFWTRKRWEEHRRGLGKGEGEGRGEYESARAAAAVDDGVEGGLFGEGFDGFDDPSWNGTDFLPQGTVGCVVLDREGTLCVATSTGGITNKLPGRVGDTPTLGAGFWAEEWAAPPSATGPISLSPSPLSSFTSLLTSCLPSLTTYLPIPQIDNPVLHHSRHRATAISGTGNGDSFLRLAAVRTASAIARFSPHTSLQTAVTAVAGPNGMLQQSAGDRWLKSGEGEGGMIGIELEEGGQGRVVADFNCGGMFRAWIDESGEERVMVFRGEY